jgi:alkanesulfonate monooxygenase SsuD/methylene tetrahydromethanopterin reductase-like flavin-dependent oxidoreductase (luciferase family)
MKFGINIPPFADFYDARVLAALAADAEAAGWDGFFIWDHLLFGPVPIADPWVALAAIALATERVRIGPMVTPLPRRRPHKLAREIMSIDHLSRGRLTLGVGIGAAPFEWGYLGEETSQRIRGEMLDEGLEVLTGLMTGQPFAHQGTHYRVEGELPGNRRAAQFLPGTAQTPRVPIWVGGIWPKKRPFQRAARWDGAVPLKVDGTPSPQDISSIREYVLARRHSPEPFELVATGATEPEREGAQRVRNFEQAGATWWFESIDPWRFGWNGQGAWPAADMRRRVLEGPPQEA